MERITPEEQKKIQLKILKYTADICKENNIKYFLGGGTLLGAIRHKGYIPWDDDIDIMIPREDYEKLIELFSVNENSDYKLLCYKNCDDYYYPFAKIVNKRTKMEELKFNDIKEMGIYIDVFPIDFLPNNEKKIKQIFKKYDKIYKLVAIQNARCLNKVTESKIKLFLKKLLLPIVRKPKVRKMLLKKIDKLAYNYKDTDKVACISGRYLEVEIMPKEYISDSILVDFEDMKFTIPVGYDEYLRKHYGDYMKLPPKEKQVAEHETVAYWRGEQ